MTSRSPREQKGLPIWQARDGEGYWNPERGNLRVPDGWVFVPAGDAFVTREVKKGPHWVLLKRRKGYTGTLGVFCPATSLDSAEKRRDETAESRARQRAISRPSRVRAEERYRTEMERAVLAFLAFRPEHGALAQEIARETVARATPVGSGHVGRTRKFLLAQRAELAARAYIRHRYTEYETRLVEMSEGSELAFERDSTNPLYREVKKDAQRDADEFLRRHR